MQGMVVSGRQGKGGNARPGIDLQNGASSLSIVVVVAGGQGRRPFDQSLRLTLQHNGIRRAVTRPSQGGKRHGGIDQRGW